MKRILLTGGGSTGHVAVNLALIPHLKRNEWEIHYIGSHNGIERELIEPIPEVTYYPISTGKLRRYFDINNFKDPFRVIKGIGQAYRIIRKVKPSIVFSKGGFVSVPVILASRITKTPVISHESDMSPGLANKISMPFASKVCVTFPETLKHLPEDKGILLGSIVREELKKGSKRKGLHFCDFTDSKPVILVMGGSQGAKRINEAIRSLVPTLTKKYHIVHLCGKGKIDETMNVHGYKQFEYIKEELPDILAMTDLVVTRAGSNSIYEFLDLQIPMILVPLPLSQSRGDQIQNAESFKKQGFAEVIQEEDVMDESLHQLIEKTYSERNKYKGSMQRSEQSNPLEKLYELLERFSKY
ncbi:undecaprenyldiphospho-muramoylpentapeptide beta-N-acetylglucosaminyltransferase [Pseudalkalibacillus salsuginis]|uniref:undecaprenyldiphospho-muramoylpentapeptide beta-N-acetylglucosaminyltransferase n=1 Tax=Pseudalkalibacillus salsuginis TaxID=2910972 RepID=UPI001F325E7D|nr:undecaprenyldiphospho-muramoylpentapeptide beta-N-acetylglucosaminyltransferase [Pseudalkalibacillus salsuginis]MCF6410355.1 undecaprenyldiphospho-muramoylpentapeptide beta-N-acetylglucosaminyltransferase [Pseudalkalibacillus salsuginis]